MTPRDRTTEQRAILTELALLREQITRLEREEKALWQAFYSIADELAGKGKPYRFFDEASGKVIARIIAHSERIDDALLLRALSPEQWETVTDLVRTLNPVLLEEAMRAGTISREVVENAVERKDTARKHGPRDATAEDLEALELEEAR